MPRYRFKILPVDLNAGPPTAGWRFIFFIIIVLVAAINTGNNLMYLVLATLCGAVFVSWVLAGRSLAGLQAGVVLPDEMFAGEESVLEFTASRAGASGVSRSLSLELRSNGDPEGHLPYLETLDAGRTARVQGLIRFPRRGSLAMRGVSVSTTYPFGLLRRRHMFSAAGELIVYPAVVPLEEILRLGGEDRIVSDSLVRGRSGGLINIRPFLPGDDRRLLHWKASAKTDSLMVKEMSRQHGTTVLIHFNSLRQSAAAADDQELFEIGVSVAASLAYHGRADGIRLIFSAPGLRLTPEAGDEHVRVFLRYLATVKAEGRLLSGTPVAFPNRRHNERAIVVDPLNSGIVWGGDCSVFDRAALTHFREERR